VKPAGTISNLRESLVRCPPPAINRWAIVGGVFLATLLALVAHPASAATNDVFARGLDFSRAGQFPEAAAAFEESARAQPAAGTLVNLGLAEWQRGHAGPAILAWEQALWIDPFAARAKANLNFARQASQVDAPQLSWYEAASTWLPANAWVWLSGVTLWLAVGLLVLPGIFRRRQTGWQQWLAALAFGMCLFCLAANLGVVSRAQTGFVLKKYAPLRLTPTHDGELISTLSGGEPVRKLRTHGNYIFVRSLTGAGWLDRNDFGPLCPP
jgi:tetratricopeptide (TPR) repeat protein